MKKYIERIGYLEQLKAFVNKALIKVIVGQRRVGKSYFLFQIMDYIRKLKPNAPILYINKEDLAYDFIKNYTDLVHYAEAQREGVDFAYLLIDEVQEINEFEKALRHFQTQETWDIYITGSNADLLSGELATYLSGRYIEMEIYPLSYVEFIKFHNLEESEAAFTQYIKYGGLPYLINLKLHDDVVFDYLKNIYAAILFKDVVARYNIRNISFLEQLIRYIAANIGQVHSAKRITDFLKSQHVKMNNNTVMDYLSYLTKAFFIFQVKRNDLKGKRILEIGEKYYFGDLGIRHALKQYTTQDISQLLENAVFLHLKTKKYQVHIGKWNKKEIDFVCSKAEEKIYIQVTLSLSDEKVRQREYGNLLTINDNHRKIVVTADSYTTAQYAGIETWNIRTFLLEF